MKLSRVDKTAIQNFDEEYLFKRGLSFYYDDDFDVALEFFHLAIAMGNTKALRYVGDCYIYGKGVPLEVDLGLSYYKVAIGNDDIDATYLLGKIYDNGKLVEKDSSLAIYYYKKALDLLEDDYNEWFNHPELFFLISNEMKPGGRMTEDLEQSYEYLLIAKEGYEKLIKEGAFYLEKDLKKVNKQMKDDIYNEIKESVEKKYLEKYFE